MYNLLDLKENIIMTEVSTECPIKGCNVIVDRKHRSGNEGKNFTCQVHEIQITPSTFIYNSHFDNLLWNEEEDKELLEDIFKEKTESRMENENSEDALTWNVFRYLEKNELLSSLLNEIVDNNHKIIDIIYWSYSKNEKKLWSFLKHAILKFGETIDRSSEPDIIILTDKTLFFIEAKLFSPNTTSGSGVKLEKHINNPKKYVSGVDGHFDSLFKSDYKSIVKDQKYELMRFWILGTWIAKELKLKFHLINLVLESRELNIESDFGKHIVPNSNNTFSRYTWESIYSFIKNTNKYDSDSLLILDYFKYKAAGYDKKGQLKKAFNSEE
jgi:hypothetical protein